MGIQGTDRIGYTLKRSQHYLRLRMDAMLSRDGLTMAQYVALSLFERSPRMSNAEIARRAFVTPQTMHRIVTGLQAGGLISSSADPRNKRVILRSLTERGRELLQKGHRTAEAVDAQMLSGFTREEAQQLRRLLERTIANLSPGAEPDSAAHKPSRDT